MLLRRLTYVAVLIFAPGYVFSQGISRNKRTSDYVPCEYGWFYFQEKCYGIGGKERTLSWPRAAQQCIDLGASLATIETKEENDFLVALILLEVRRSTWIGLNDRENESIYLWHSGSTSEYRYWNKVGDEPSGFRKNNEDCTEIVFNWPADYIGVWNDLDCERSLAYICEKNSDPTLRSPDLRFCSPNQSGGFRFGSSCYHLVRQMKTWEEAEHHCREIYGGHLITVLDKKADYFLKYLLMGIHSDNWIGIKIRGQSQQKWSSGWYVEYNGFSKGIQNFIEGTCVVRSQEKLWTIVSCSKKYTFICEKSHVLEKTPVPKLTVNDSYCPSILASWRDLGGDFCYYIETKEVCWHDASFQCRQTGGKLVSVHSEEEDDILPGFTVGNVVLIGLFRKDVKKNTFGWADGSKLDFENWTLWETNDENEKCVEAQETDIVCERTDKKALICAIKKITPDITVTITEEPELDSSHSKTNKILIGVVVSMVLVTILLGVFAYSSCRMNTEQKKKSSAVCLHPLSPTINPQNGRSSEKRISETDSDYEIVDF